MLRRNPLMHLQSTVSLRHGVQLCRVFGLIVAKGQRNKSSGLTISKSAEMGPVVPDHAYLTYTSSSKSSSISCQHESSNRRLQITGSKGMHDRAQHTRFPLHCQHETPKTRPGNAVVKMDSSTRSMDTLRKAAKAAKVFSILWLGLRRSWD